jgi:hypothetical protein
MDARLMAVLNFDWEDLRANRMGRISARQEELLRRDNRPLTLTFAGGMILFTALAVISLLSRAEKPFQWVLVAVFGALAIFAAWLMVSGLQAAGQVHHEVEVVVGVVELKTTPDRNGRPLYMLMIGGRRFLIDRTLYDTLVVGEHYVVYYVDGFGIISAEPD